MMNRNSRLKDYTIAYILSIIYLVKTSVGLEPKIPKEPQTSVFLYRKF